MEAVVKTVEPRIIKEGTSEQRTIYDVIDLQDNKWTAWEKPVAEKAWGLKGVPALWLVEIKQKDSYTNRTLKGIEAKQSDGYGPALNTMESQLGSVDPRTFAPLPGVSTGFPSETKAALVQEPTFKDRTIWRQAATKVAAALGAGSPLEFWSNVDDLIRFYETGEKPQSVQFILGSQERGADPADPVGAAMFGSQSDDDIPF